MEDTPGWDVAKRMIDHYTNLLIKVKFLILDVEKVEIKKILPEAEVRGIKTYENTP